MNVSLVNSPEKPVKNLLRSLNKNLKKFDLFVLVLSVFCGIPAYFVLLS